MSTTQRPPKVADLNRYRTVLSLDGRAMTMLANIAAIHRLKCHTTASHSATIRRAIEVLQDHVAPLLDRPDSHADVLRERNAIRDARLTREGIAGWSLDSRKRRAEEGRPPLKLDMEENEDATDEDDA